jgi:hypothetical protein
MIPSIPLFTLSAAGGRLGIYVYTNYEFLGCILIFSSYDIGGLRANPSGVNGQMKSTPILYCNSLFDRIRAVCGRYDEITILYQGIWIQCTHKLRIFPQQTHCLTSLVVDTETISSITLQPMENGLEWILKKR